MSEGAHAAPGPLPDVLSPGMRVVFVGINPSITSGAVTSKLEWFARLRAFVDL